MPNNKQPKSIQVGTVEVMTFRSTQIDWPFWFPIYSIFKGYSTGHVALKFIFYHTALFEEFIADNPRIPQLTYTDPKTGKKCHEVYVSFWQNNKLPISNLSMLVQHQYDCEQSANGSPMEYNHSILERLGLRPIKKITASRVPILSDFMYTNICLPPSIILHSSKLEFVYGTKIRETAEIYVRNYTHWRAACIRQNNAQLTAGISKTALLAYEDQIITAKITMMVSEETLQNLMFPTKNLSHETFINILEKNFVSFGYPERDSVSLPLIHTEGRRPDSMGLELRPMLKYIADVADNPEIFAYRLFGLNCAQTTFNILWRGIKASASIALKQSFQLPWYVRWFGLTLTPNLIIQQAARVREHIQQFSVPYCDPPLDKSNLRKAIQLKLALKPQILAFSKDYEQHYKEKQQFIEKRQQIENLLGLSRSNSL